MKKKKMVTPKIPNHKYNTRSKRNCYSCSSTQGCISAKEADIQNGDRLTFPKRLVGRKSNTRLVACSAQSCSGLPDELIYTILLLIPAKLLHENMRFLSRVWRQTIISPCFTTDHLHIWSARTQGLLFDHPHRQNIALYIQPTTSIANPEFQVTELPKPPFECRIRCSYHGLVLLQHKHNKDQFHLVNLITKSIVSLPSFPMFANLSDQSLESGRISRFGCAISHASSINRYKVVIGIHFHFQGIELFHYLRPQVWICTVGIDQNWRKLDLQGTDEICGTLHRLNYASPTIVGGIVYWNNRVFPYGCALDVDTETFYRFTMLATPNTVPKILLSPEYRIISLQTGLGLVKSYRPDQFVGYSVIWELYELSDLKSSKWTKIIDIDLLVILSQIPKYFQPRKFFPLLKPVVYTNDEKLWFVNRGSSTCMFCYHMRGGNVIRVPLTTRTDGANIGAYHHVNTLLELKNY